MAGRYHILCMCVRVCVGLLSAAAHWPGLGIPDCCCHHGSGCSRNESESEREREETLSKYNSRRATAVPRIDNETDRRNHKSRTQRHTHPHIYTLFYPLTHSHTPCSPQYASVFYLFIIPLHWIWEAVSENMIGWVQETRLHRCKETDGSSIL